MDRAKDSRGRSLTWPPPLKRHLGQPRERPLRAKRSIERSSIVIMVKAPRPSTASSQPATVARPAPRRRVVQAPEIRSRPRHRSPSIGRRAAGARPPGGGRPANGIPRIRAGQTPGDAGRAARAMETAGLRGPRGREMAAGVAPPRRGAGRFGRTYRLEGSDAGGGPCPAGEVLGGGGWRGRLAAGGGRPGGRAGARGLGRAGNAKCRGSQRLKRQRGARSRVGAWATS